MEAIFKKFSTACRVIVFSLAVAECFAQLWHGSSVGAIMWGVIAVIFSFIFSIKKGDDNEC